MAGGTAIEPRFAERAAGLLDRGDVPAALSVLLAGVKAYPAYATAHLLLRQCYERLGKPQDAAQQASMARRLLPGLPGNPGTEGVTDAAENGIEFMLRQLPHVHLRPEQETAGPHGSPDERPDAGKLYGEDDVPEVAVPIVSPTLAEIYARQGKYREAIEAYRRLAQQRPAEAGRYRERLEELEKLLQGVDKLGEA
jgi:tetratricopeptide (TPR) repeat protein